MFSIISSCHPINLLLRTMRFDMSTRGAPERCTEAQKAPSRSKISKALRLPYRIRGTMSCRTNNGVFCFDKVGRPETMLGFRVARCRFALDPMNASRVVFTASIVKMKSLFGELKAPIATSFHLC